MELIISKAVKKRIIKTPRLGKKKSETDTMDDVPDENDVSNDNESQSSSYKDDKKHLLFPESKTKRGFFSRLRK